MDDEPLSDESDTSTGILEKISSEEKTMMITQLIGLGESQRRIYERLNKGGELENTNLGESYEHHEKELELLIAYQKENNRS